jgi:hypothetical protein
MYLFPVAGSFWCLWVCCQLARSGYELAQVSMTRGHRMRLDDASWCVAVPSMCTCEMPQEVIGSLDGSCCTACPPGAQLVLLRKQACRTPPLVAWWRAWWLPKVAQLKAVDVHADVCLEVHSGGSSLCC